MTPPGQSDLPRRPTPEAAITSALVMTGTEFKKWAPASAAKILAALRELGWDVIDARKRVTHGRHCTCSACAQEDWPRITGPCGLHGPDCPAAYQPIGPVGTVLP